MFIPLLTSLFLATPVGDITWEKEYAPARARAQEEGRILFVSILSDDEARSDQFWDDVYSDRRVRALSEETVNLVACLDAQGKKRSSSTKQAGLSRDEARYMEAAIRDELMAKNAEGVVASPQHLWFSSAGELLQSVVFEMTADEMVWCFVNARRRAGLKHDPMPEGLRAPLRFLTREPYVPADGDTHGRALTSAEAKQELKTMKASMLGAGQAARFVRLAFTDDKAAQEYVYKELQSGVATWGGSGITVRALHTMGLVAPDSGWEIFEYYADHKEARVRNECAVGLEQVGTSDGLKLIKTMLRKEKDAGVKKNWLRALGSCGRSTSSVRKQILGLANRERDPVLKANILFALGWLDHHEDVREVLVQTLYDANADVRLRTAAVCAIALGRDESQLEAVRKFAGGDGIPAPLSEAATAAVAILEGGDLMGLQASVQDSCDDIVSRERVFFRPPPEPEPR
ncbi:hypothetical protein CMO84_11900 [Candidatus Woesearchaeota archaeon]|jgi:hypothetical protein|nr:hypothetical protein [Candidatus Woesearchaeota archaeon]MDP6738664.1 hypothetical protein [Planctomycetota bacterium]